MNLKFENVTKSEDIYKVYVEKSKTDIVGKGFTFFISGDDKIHIDNYFSCFKVLKGRLFCKIKNGNGTACVLGKNVIAKIPFTIAKDLGLPDPETFTGHCFRRSGATIMKDSGASKITLKRAGRWQSDSVCDGYIAESSFSKLEISNLVGQAGRDIAVASCKKRTSTNSKVNKIEISNCHGFVLNL